MKLINIGFGNMVSAGRVVAVVSPGLRTGQTSGEGRTRAGDADRRLLRPQHRAVLIMDSDHVVLSALQPETVASRAAGQEGRASMEEETSHGE